MNEASDLIFDTTIHTIGHIGDVIKMFTFESKISHPLYSGVTTDFTGEPLVELPRGTDLKKWIVDTFGSNEYFVKNMMQTLAFEHLKASVETEVVNPIDPEPEPEPEPETPEEIREKMRPLPKKYLRLTLIRNGIPLARVKAVIASIEDDMDRELAEVEWDDSETYRRLHPLLIKVAHALGLTDVQMDSMWLMGLAAMDNESA